MRKELLGWKGIVFKIGAFSDCTVEAIVRLRSHCARRLLFHWLLKLEGDESSKVILGHDSMKQWAGAVAEWIAHLPGFKVILTIELLIFFVTLLQV